MLIVLYHGICVSRQLRFQSYPDVLIVQTRRFVYDNWVPEKIGAPRIHAHSRGYELIECRYSLPMGWCVNVSIDVELLLDMNQDMSGYRAHGQQAGETEFPAAAPPQPQPSAAIVTQLEGMGFSHNACSRAV